MGTPGEVLRCAQDDSKQETSRLIELDYALDVSASLAAVVDFGFLMLYLTHTDTRYHA